MSNKKRGSNYERELVKLFTTQGWRAVRVAGSGTGEDSPCDIIAGKKGKKSHTVEAKSTQKKTIYITKKQIEEFMLFTEIIGLSPVIAVRFPREGWLFLNPKNLEDTGKMWKVTIEEAKEKGKRFSQYFE